MVLPAGWGFEDGGECGGCGDNCADDEGGEGGGAYDDWGVGEGGLDAAGDEEDGG